jgi:fumarate reductase subunit C
MPDEAERARGVIAWSSFFFVLLQSVCTFFTALDSLRLIIGLGSLATITQVGEVWDRFHANWIRMPMMTMALVGALLNLVVLIRIRRLRRRPAARWRQRELTSREIRMERVQLILSLATLALIGVEELTHFHTFRRL